VALSAKKNYANRYHVVLSEGENWAVLLDGNVRASKVFPDQDSAIEFAKETALKVAGQVVIHKKSGEIQDLVSYEN
jgi:predicted nucleic acid-binding protein